MADLVSDGGEFSCVHCTSKLKLTVTTSSSQGDSKKLANMGNSMFLPPGGMCQFPAGVPPSPCPGIPPNSAKVAGQSTVKIDGQTALGDGCLFMCPKMQMVTLSSAGQKVAKHDEASVSLQTTSLVADLVPVVGSGKSLLELFLGTDPITGEPASRSMAAVGIVLGMVPGGKALVKGKKMMKVAKKLGQTSKVTPKKLPPIKALPKQPPSKPSVTNTPAYKQHMEKEIERYKKNIDVQKKHLTPRDLDAARREMKGEVVKLKDSGVPFNHVKEVNDAQRGLKNTIMDIKNELSNPSISSAQKAQLEELLSEGSKLRDHSTGWVPPLR